MALFIPLLIYLTFFGLLYAYLITWLIIIRRSDTYKAFRRSAVAKIKRPAKASYFFFLLALFLALISTLVCFTISFFIISILQYQGLIHSLYLSRRTNAYEARVFATKYLLR
jgi:prepilin signal peptidase PulO-like enzyme (type II secretory pathway)